MGLGAAMNALNSFLTKAVAPIAMPLGLEHLPRNFPWITYSALGFTFVHLVVAPYGSRWIAPVSYGKLQGKRARNNWDIHVVSLVHALIIVTLASRSLNQPGLVTDPTYGFDQIAELTNSVAVGYFVWDTIDAIVNFTDLGPILQYYSVRFLFWELSTPFLNIHWFLDKTGYTGSTFQLINGVFLLSTFFLVRIVYGWYTSISFWRIMFKTSGGMPMLYWVVFMTGHAVLMSLNLIWLSKMIKALRKRFDSEQDPKRPLLTPSDGVQQNYSDTNPLDGAA